MVVKGLSKDALLDGAIDAYIIGVIALVVRIIWVVFTGAVVSIGNARKRRFDWKNELLISWAGMRGIVSLASALAIPLALPNGSPFPNRDMVLYITFCFILLTLIGQGLSLPLLIRYLSFQKELERGTSQQQRESMAMRLALAACEHLDVRYRQECQQIPTFAQLRTSYEGIVSSAVVASGDSQDSQRVRSLEKRYKEALLELINVQRKELVIARREGTYDHEITLETEDQLNLEEARLTRAEPVSQIIAPGALSSGTEFELMRPSAQIVNPASRLIKPGELAG
jgi:CPA1 family monovalent cation:H+ antiporter